VEQRTDGPLHDKGSASDLATIAGLATTGGVSGSAPPIRLERGTLVGRYVALSELGAGGMGVVYAGYDPELDRKVALKLLRPKASRAPGDKRLLGEAQALAKLSHPNVVAVHDVGTMGSDVWLAMEFVAGQPMDAWLAARPRGVHEVLSVLRPVGLGLRAAHEVGLVHRDVKPGNVMLGDDGRVRLLDFGLARGAPDSGENQRDTMADSGDRSGRGASKATKIGAPVGTPAYMAPEQISARHADARSDQFSFCVTLFEALYGKRPFGGAVAVELALNVLEGKVDAPPATSKVPRWLRHVVTRGLSVDPADRFASMEALLDAIRRGQAGARRWKAAGVVGAVALAGAGIVGWQHAVAQRAAVACEEAGAGFAEAVWSDGVHTELRDGIVATGAPHAAATADRLLPRLDAQAETLSKSRAEACVASQIRKTWDSETYERSLWCLQERQMELGALVAMLSAPSKSALQHAVAAATQLRRVEQCTDTATLARLPAPPAEDREEIEQVRSQLSRTNAHVVIADYADGLPDALENLERAEALAWPPLVAAAGRLAGDLHAGMGSYEQAEALYESAYFTAAKGGATEEALLAAEQLTRTVGGLRARHRDGLRWSKQAEVLRSTLPDPAGLREATTNENKAEILRQMGEYSRAEALVRETLATREAVLGPNHLLLTTDLRQLGVIYESMGELERARPFHERALTIRTEALGPDHPTVGVCMLNLANVDFRSARYAKARDWYARALTLQTEGLGAEHPNVAMTLLSLANVHLSLGTYTKSIELYERALAIQTKVLGAAHPSVAYTQSNIAGVWYLTEAYDRADDYYTQALDTLREALGPEHAHVGMAMRHVARVAMMTDRNAEAESFATRAVAIHEASFGPDHPEVARSLRALADVHRMSDRFASAQTMYERSLTITEASFGHEHLFVARVLIGLAQVALAQGQGDAAVAFAQRAVDIRASAPAHDLAEVQFLLATTPSRGCGGCRACTCARGASACDLSRAGTRSRRGARHGRRVARWLIAEHLHPRYGAFGSVVGDDSMEQTALRGCGRAIQRSPMRSRGIRDRWVR